MVWRSRSDVWALAAVVASIVLMLGTALTTSPVAVAQSSEVSAEGGGGAADAEVAIIMDASSSMLQPDEGGTRLDVAKRASLDLVDSLPDTARVGMLAYGTQVSDAPENHAEGCEDIRTLAPVDRVDKDRLRGEISGLEATGYTPIGNALRAAAEEFGDDASERSIVLVSDGIDTCAPPPACEVAQELADEGIGLAVHVVGFRADEATRQELECLSDATGGTYRQADDAQSLSDSLKFLTQRAIESYESFGTEFEFADSPDEAKYLGQGLYQSTVRTTPGGVTSAPEQYIRLAVPEGHTARVAITALPEVNLGQEHGGEGVNTYLSAENDSDSRCWSSSNSAQTSGGGFEPPESAVIQVGRDEQGDCDDSAWVVAAQFGDPGDPGDASGEQELSVEMSVQFEPLQTEESAAWAEGSPGGGETPEPVAIESPRSVVGGNSFNNATEVTDGAFTDSIVPGEFRYYSFPVEWGQRPVVTVRVGPSVREAADTLHVDMSGPMRHDIASDWVPFYEDVKEETFAVDRPINYRNRDANQGGAERALAGRHYVAVSLNVTGSNAPLGVDQPYEIGIRMDGQPGAGPAWEPVNEPGPPPSATPPHGDDAAASPAPEGDDDENAEQVAMEEDGPVSSTVWLVLGGGVLLLVGVIAGLWALTRRSQRDSR